MEWSSSKNFKEFTLIPSQRAHQTKLRFPRSYFQEFLKNNLSLSLQRLLTASKLRSFDRFVPLRVVGTTKRPRRERGVGVSYARLCEGEGSRLNEANSPSLGVSLPVSTVLCFPRLLCSLSPSQFQSNSVVGAAPRPKSILERRRTRETERLPDEEARGTEITDLRASSDLAAYRGCRTIPLFDERS